MNDLNVRMNNIEELVEYHFETVEQRRNGCVATVVRMKGLEILKQNRFSEDKRASLAKFYKMLVKKYQKQIELNFMTYEDFTQTFVVLFIEAALKLEELESLDELLNDEKLYNSRIKYINQNIKHDIVKVMNPTSEKVHVGNIDGKAVFKLIDLNSGGSINERIENEGEVTELISLLGDENKLFTYGDEAHYNHFLQWFIENKEDVLTKNQLERFNVLKEIYIAATDKSKETLEQRRLMFEQADINVDGFGKLAKNIKKRVIKKYDEAHENSGMNGFSTKRRETINEVMKQYVEKCDSTEWTTAEDRQVEMTKYVARFYDEFEEFELTVTKNMTLDQKKEIVRAVNAKGLLSHKLIRLIKANVIEYIEQYKDVKVKPAQQEWDGYSEKTFSGLIESEEQVFNIHTDGMLKAQKKEQEARVREQNQLHKRDTKDGEVKTYCYKCYLNGELNDYIDDGTKKQCQKVKEHVYYYDIEEMQETGLQRIS